ncbi:MAG: ATP-binding cassette domain-containing protein [Deltaproteobacteria bacterium]|nr:ATP-binding cassette domain-containing protein [Deltaproteobacteria bacterium]MCB9787880.1 ATP-binding cassette domain-containing protein [Deltaproteobacteria bacterium]
MIQVSNLTKTYGDLEALKGVSFEIQRGEIVGFLGPNGAGKSTTMKILTGFMPQTAGQVSVDGVDVNTDGLAVRRRIGYLPESTPLYPEMLVYDYLAYVATIRGIARGDIHGRVARAAGLCGIADRAGQAIGTLSKGLKQRVGLAQALIHEPDILILDEPTSGLDPNQIVEIRNLVRELGRDRTIILSTHNLPEVMATCNRMIIVHQGRVVADGTPAELQAREEERPRVRVVLRGAPAAGAAEALRSLAGVDSVKDAMTAEDGATALELTAAAGTDVRPQIYALAVERGWELLELHRQVLDLEGIFRKLTQVV